MAIEPLSSAMTYQAQSVKSTQQAPEKANTDQSNSSQSAQPPVDNKTVVVASTNQTDDGNSQSSPNEKDQTTDNQRIKKAVDDLNKKMFGSEALFGIHDETNRVTIKIVDKETKEVIKEIPPEKTLDMIAKIWEIAGLMVDERR